MIFISAVPLFSAHYLRHWLKCPRRWCRCLAGHSTGEGLWSSPWNTHSGLSGWRAWESWWPRLRTDLCGETGANVSRSPPHRENKHNKWITTAGQALCGHVDAVLYIYFFHNTCSSLFLFYQENNKRYTYLCHFLAYWFQDLIRCPPPFKNC